MLNVRHTMVPALACLRVVDRRSGLCGGGRAPSPSVPRVCPTFGRPSGGPQPGCDCGASNVAVLPWVSTEPPRSDVQGVAKAKAGQEVGIQFEANPICRGQSIGGSEGTIDWGDGSGLEKLGDILQGCRTHTFRSDGNFDVRVRVSLECTDFGAASCKRRCVAEGHLSALISPGPAQGSSVSWWFQDKYLAAIFGGAFAIIFLLIAIFDRDPPVHSVFIYRVLLSLTAAGLGAVIPGFIDVTVSNYVRAGGALALFVIVYFWNPAAPRRAG